MSLDVRTGGEAALLDEVWDTRPGILGWLGAVNHKQVGKRFVVTAMLFFLIGGVQALLMRIQLGSPESTFLDPETYNQLFTMHGTTMMFLFAVPITEAVAIYLVPLMIGARDMPFPRANAFGYWAYLFGGIFLYASFLPGAVPNGGWFAYTPLSGPEFTPGANLDFWLLGVTFVEIAGIVAAVEIIVLVLKFRAPGMTISRMPLLAWGTLVAALMVLFAFPPLVMGSIMLELDRKVGTVFFDVAAGGDPLLWQHVFWWFGHPEVYIMSVPAFGIVSTLVPVFSRTRIVGYTFIAAATVAIGIISFGVWVHHMFATGIGFLGLSLFAAGSLLIAVPSGVQIFAWIATIWEGRVRWDVPMLWVMGFFVIFIMGGLSGVMFAVFPFDLQAHDTFFVVAHFHYVLLGSVVFPVLGGIVYWLPKATGRLANPRLGRWAFWVAFVGFHVTFFPQHILGLLGMARRIATYPVGFGWHLYNIVSTVGAFVFAAGILLFVIDVVRGAMRGPRAGGDPWEANTLEWAATSPPPSYNFAVIPAVSSRDPLWDDDPVAGQTDEQRWWQPQLDPAAPRRHMVVTSVLDAVPESITTLPLHSLWPLTLAASIALLLWGALVDAVALAGVGMAAVVISVVAWLWARQDGGGAASAASPTPTPAGRTAHPTGWWGMIAAVGALASMVATAVFAWLYLGGQAEQWPPPEVAAPGLLWPTIATGAAVLAVALGVWLQQTGGRGRATSLQLAAAVTMGCGVALCVALTLTINAFPFTWSDHAYASAFYLATGFMLVCAAAGLAPLMGLQLHLWGASVDARTRIVAVNTALYWYYVAGAWLAVYVTLYLVPTL